VSGVDQPEHAPQNRVVAMFCDELGYRYLDNWADRDGNSNIDFGFIFSCMSRPLTLLQRGSSNLSIRAAPLQRSKGKMFSEFSHTAARRQERENSPTNGSSCSRLRSSASRSAAASSFAEGAQNFSADFTGSQS
jgi:hypothetical protein